MHPIPGNGASFLLKMTMPTISAAACLLGSAVVDAAAGVGPLGAAAAVEFAAVVLVAVPVLVAVGAPATSEKVSTACTLRYRGVAVTYPAHEYKGRV